MDGFLDKIPINWTDETFITAFSGAVSGAITATVVCPLDVLKTRLQVQQRATGSLRYNGIIGGLSTIVKEEGLRGMYKGLTPTLLALLPNWAVYWTAYEYLKKTLQARFPTDTNSSIIHVSSASVAGACTLVITNPLWVVKTRLQTQNMGFAYGKKVVPVYTGTFHALKSIVCEEGLVGLYSGLAPSLMGVAHVAVQFPLYEALKKHIATSNHDGKVDELQLHELVVASAFSKVVASTATYPHEVIRSHMHVAGSGPFTGLLGTCANIVKEEGVRGFYRGCFTNLLRTTPAAAVTFTSFEMLSRYLRHLAAEKRQAEFAQTPQSAVQKDAGPVNLRGKAP